MRKRTCLALALLLPALMGVRADGGTAKTGTAKLVKLKDGPTKGYMLSYQPVLTYGTNSDQFELAYTKGGTKATVSNKLDEIEYYSFGNAFTLDDTDWDAAVPENGEFGAAILGRTLTKGDWNTFCVPFNMTADQVAEVFGKETKLRKYKSHTSDNVLQFESATTIEAGVAYLVHPSIDNPEPKGITTVTNVTVSKQTADKGLDDDGYGFVGSFVPVKDIKTDGTNLLVISGGKLGVPATNEGHNTLRGMRAYMVIPKSEASNAKAFTLSLDEEDGGTTTAIASVKEANARKASKVFTLAGQYVGDTTAGLSKGVYVVGGRKVVVK